MPLRGDCNFDVCKTEFYSPMKEEKRISEHYLKVALFLTLFYEKNKWRKLERELIKLIAKNFLEQRNYKLMSRHELHERK